MITFLKTATDAEIAEAEVTIENNSALKKIAEDTDRDFYMSAEDAKKYGIVDEIITKSPVDVEEDE